jgi:holliday junction DNA helicase RuvA
MIAYLRGRIVHKSVESAVIEASGVGYEVFFCPPSLEALGPEGAEVQVYIAESVGMYDGTRLYGFRNTAEKRLFDLFRGAVPNTGAKKAMEYLGKAVRSMPDFAAAVAAADAKKLHALFGFTAKTAERLIAALKDKMPEAAAGDADRPGAAGLVQAMNALTALGFRAGEARQAVEDAARAAGAAPGAEALIRAALRLLAPGAK